MPSPRASARRSESMARERSVAAAASAAAASSAFPAAAAEDDVRGIGAALYALLLDRWPIAEPGVPSGLQPAETGPTGEPVEPRAVNAEIPFQISAAAVRAVQPSGGIRSAPTLLNLLQQATTAVDRTDLVDPLTATPPVPLRDRPDRSRSQRPARDGRASGSGDRRARHPSDDTAFHPDPAECTRPQPADLPRGAGLPHTRTARCGRTGRRRGRCPAHRLARANAAPLTHADAPAGRERKVEPQSRAIRSGSSFRFSCIGKAAACRRRRAAAQARGRR